LAYSAPYPFSTLSSLRRLKAPRTVDFDRRSIRSFFLPKNAQLSFASPPPSTCYRAAHRNLRTVSDKTNSLPVGKACREQYKPSALEASRQTTTSVEGANIRNSSGKPMNLDGADELPDSQETYFSHTLLLAARKQKQQENVGVSRYFSPPQQSTTRRDDRVDPYHESQQPYCEVNGTDDSFENAPIHASEQSDTCREFNMSAKKYRPKLPKTQGGLPSIHLAPKDRHNPLFVPTVNQREAAFEAIGVNVPNVAELRADTLHLSNSFIQIRKGSPRRINLEYASKLPVRVNSEIALHKCGLQPAMIRASQGFDYMLSPEPTTEHTITLNDAVDYPEHDFSFRASSGALLEKPKASSRIGPAKTMRFRFGNFRSKALHIQEEGDIVDSSEGDLSSRKFHESGNNKPPAMPKRFVLHESRQLFTHD
jgi:hypothetical protein